MSVGLDVESLADTFTTTGQRCEPRDLCEIEASIYLLPRTHLPCIIKDLSPKGAKIRIDPGIKLPKNIFLSMPVFGDIAETRHCELRWRIEDVAGLKFVFLSQKDLAVLKELASQKLEDNLPFGRHHRIDAVTQAAPSSSTKLFHQLMSRNKSG